jgi:outer membrane protein TolC
MKEGVLENMFRLSRLKIFILLSILLQLFDFKIFAGELLKSEDGKKDILIVNLEESLNIALEKNRQRLVSKAAIEIARAQHEQALSAYWPQLKLTATAIRMDEDPNFTFPSSTFTVPALGSVPVPERDVKHMDRDTLLSSLALTYPVYTGGKRAAISKQAELGIKIARESARRTDLQVIYDVNRMYYGSVLARSLRELGQETLERFEMTLDLTERLYKNGAGTVKKTDYLRTKVIVSSIRSMLELLISNDSLAKAALINSMGLDWKTQIELSEEEIPFRPFKSDLNKLVTDANQFNSDLTQLQLALKIARAKIKENKSGYFPMIAFTGNLRHIDNSYDKGLTNSTNSDSWTIGLAMEIPLFNGFRTRSKVKESIARLNKIKQEKILFREGVALQIKDAIIQISRSQGQVGATEEALSASRENRELNVRAYQDELVETRDVIEAQLLESFINAQYLKALYDHVENLTRLEFIVGKAVKSTIELGVIK